jgi:hypothetical protein
MHDPAFACEFERLGKLPGKGQSFFGRNSRLRDSLCQRQPVHEFHHQRAGASRFFETVNGCNVWVVQCGQELRFAFETRHPLRILGEGARQNLQRNVAPELCVRRAVHFSHAPAPSNATTL